MRPTDLLQNLGPAQRAMVAIARALQDQDEHSGGVLVLDEPTASLPEPEVETLLSALRIFARSGQSVLFISHRTPEVLGLANRVTVLRDGKKVATVDGAGLTEERIVELIVGRELETLERDHHPVSSGSEGAILHARNLHGPRLNGVTMDLREREVLGIAGLVGCGRSELLKVLFGAYKVDSGTILLDGQPIRFATVGEAMNSGFAYVPEDRTTEASFAGMSVRENLSAANVGRYWKGMKLRHGREQSDAKALIEEYGVRTSGDRAGLLDAVGRQPAEGHHRSLAARQAARPAARRAHARRRHRRADADLQAHRRGRRGRYVDHSGQLRQRGAVTALRPRAYHASRSRYE